MSRLYSYVLMYRPIYVHEGGEKRRRQKGRRGKWWSKRISTTSCSQVVLHRHSGCGDNTRRGVMFLLAVTEAHSWNHAMWAAASLPTQAGKMPRNPELMQGSGLYHPMELDSPRKEVTRSYFYSNHVLSQFDDTHKDPKPKVSPPLEPCFSYFYLQQWKVTIDVRSWGELTSLFLQCQGCGVDGQPLRLTSEFCNTLLYIRISIYSVLYSVIHECDIYYYIYLQLVK